MIKFNIIYLKNLPYVHFNIHIEPTKNGPNMKGITPDKFGWKGSYHHHHLPFFAIIFTILTIREINTPAGKNLLKALFPNNGVVPQGSIITNSNNNFEYFKIFTRPPPVQSIRNNIP